MIHGQTKIKWNTYLMFCVCFFLSWVFETTKIRQHIHNIFYGVLIQGHCFIWQLASIHHSDRFTWLDRQRSTLRYFSLPWVGVHAFKFSVLQLMLPFSLAWNYRRCRIYFPSARRRALHLKRSQIHHVDCVCSSIFTSELMLLYVEIKCQLDATEVFIADLIACSTCFGHHYAHHQELKSIIQWPLPVVFCAVKM